MDAPPLPESKEALKALAAALLTQISERDRALAAHRTQLDEQQVLIDKLKFELASLRRVRFGKRSEAIGAEQIALWEAELDADIEAVEARLTQLAQALTGEPRPTEKRQPKRQPLPPSLARVDEHLEPTSTRCACGAEMRRIGEDVAETLEIIPSKFYVRRRIRGKWACRCCEQLAMAPVPAAPIDKAIAGPSLLAQVIVAKYTDHLPLHRQEGIYARMGVGIARATMAGWIGQLQVLLEPLVARLQAHVLARDALQADETPVPVLAPGTGKTATGYLWAYRTVPTLPLPAASSSRCSITPARRWRSRRSPALLPCTRSSASCATAVSRNGSTSGKPGPDRCSTLCTRGCRRRTPRRPRGVPWPRPCSTALTAGRL